MTDNAEGPNRGTRILGRERDDWALRIAFLSVVIAGISVAISWDATQVTHRSISASPVVLRAEEGGLITYHTQLRALRACDVEVTLWNSGGAPGVLDKVTANLTIAGDSLELGGHGSDLVAPREAPWVPASRYVHEAWLWLLDPDYHAVDGIQDPETDSGPPSGGELDRLVIEPNGTADFLVRFHYLALLPDEVFASPDPYAGEYPDRMRSFEATHEPVTLVLSFAFPGQAPAVTRELECGWIDSTALPEHVPTIPPDGWPGVPGSDE